MRISDWSSDVCSSDLFAEVPDVGGGDRGGAGGETLRIVLVAADAAQRDHRHAGGCGHLGDQVEIVAAAGAVALDALEIGRASWRERVCTYVWIAVVAGQVKQKKNMNKGEHTAV